MKSTTKKTTVKKNKVVVSGRSYNAFLIEKIPQALRDTLNIVCSTHCNEKVRTLTLYNNDVVLHMVKVVHDELPKYEPELSSAQWKECAKSFGHIPLPELSNPDFLVSGNLKNLSFHNSLLPQLDGNPLAQAAWAYKTLSIAQKERGLLNWLGRNGGRASNSPELVKRKKIDWDKVFIQHPDKSNAEIAEMFGYTKNTVAAERYKWGSRQKAIETEDMAKKIQAAREAARAQAESDVALMPINNTTTEKE